MFETYGINNHAQIDRHFEFLCLLRLKWKFYKALAERC